MAIGASAGFAAPLIGHASGVVVTIPAQMVMSTSTVEVEFPVTVTCDNLGAISSYVYGHIDQAKTGATGSSSLSPIVCDGQAHTYLLHVFADQTPFAPGSVNASATATEYGQYNQTITGSASGSSQLAQGSVDVAANVTTSYTQNHYLVEIGAQATLQYRYTHGNGFAAAFVPATITCTLGPYGYQPFVTLDLEAAHGSAVATGYSPEQFNNFPVPVCDGTPHTYVYQIALNPGINPGTASVSIYVEDSNGQPQWPTRNADGVRTVALQNG
ncbi:MAG: hypothetical protein E6J20_11810 [Chloroflexi bacterium]|nr:MAG: hypothetical protein E6J20_11810 [Chloroflexota bacterium]